MMQEIVIAGFGGQGVMSLGQLIAYSGMLEDKNVTWLPSYGPEQRGGTANVQVVVSEDQIGSPVFSYADTAIVLNNPSFDKFEPLVKSGGLLIVNSSLVNRHSVRDDLTVIEIPATELANELGDPRIANMILLGTLIQYTNVVNEESVLQSLKKVLPVNKHHLIPLNKEALDKGAAIRIEPKAVH